MTTKKLTDVDPNQVLDAAIRCLNLKNDAALAKHFSLHAAFISRMRYADKPLGASLVLRILEDADLSPSALVRLAEKEESISHDERRERSARYRHHPKVK